MKCGNKNLGLFILRLVVGGLFLMAGIGKLSATPEMQQMIGGAAHMMGLTFLSKAVWFHIATWGEIIGGLMLILGLCTRVGAIIIFLICVVILNSMGWNLNMMDPKNAMFPALLAVNAIVLFCTGGGARALCRRFGCACCKEDCGDCNNCKDGACACDDKACKCCKPGCTCGDCVACKK